ncbi:MAG TPA: heme o synthase [Candidatus Paceibacterota bacterium]|nr:heme o synthase [Candidatus Paceibacterota bacterium]
MNRAKLFFELTKPGIIYGNALNATAGFFLASSGNPVWQIFIAVLTGLSCIIACACVLNNYFDRDIDALMIRTKSRGIVRGEVTRAQAFVFAGILGTLGTAILAIYINLLTLALALLGLFIYVCLYTPAKRVTPWSTEIGSFAGAIPALVGYTAVTNVVDIPGALLFLLIMFWQMPHFFAISIYRLEDYRAAKIPVLSVAKNTLRAKIAALIYLFLFTATVFLLEYYAHIGPIYIAVMGTASILWLVLGIYGFFAQAEKRWARKMFFYSLLVVLLLSGTLIFHR